MDVQRLASGAGRATVAATGQLDMATAPELDRAVTQAREEGATEVVVDLAGVDFLDSAGVRVLVHQARELKQTGGRLYLQGAREWVARVLEITGVADFLGAPPEPAPLEPED